MFTLRKQENCKCHIGGYPANGGAKLIVIRQRGINVYIKQGFELDNNLNKYRKYFAFINCKVFGD